MNKNIYRQADSRWGKLKYPKGKYTMSSSGCGCCAVTHCAIEQEKYKNYTPTDVRKYMVQFATCGNGTLWNGITKGLENYGYNVHWKQSDNMSDIFKVLENSLKMGVILFGSKKGPDGTCWTTGGHYISFVDYKIEDGKHWFYLKDSGGRHHDKWWSYEKSMRGDVKQVWICTSLKEEPKVETVTQTKTVEKTVEVISKADKLVSVAKELSWPKGTAESKWSYDSKTGAPTDICKKAMLERGYKTRIEFSNCGYFLNSIIFKALGVKVSILGSTSDSFKDISGFEIVHKGTIGKFELKPGDIIRYKKTNGNQHAVMILENGLIAEAGRKIRFGMIKKSTKYNASTVKKATLQVLRAKEVEA